MKLFSLFFFISQPFSVTAVTLLADAGRTSKERGKKMLRDEQNLREVCILPLLFEAIFLFVSASMITLLSSQYRCSLNVQRNRDE